MKIAVVNDIHIGKCLEHEGKVRAHSQLVEEVLPSFLKKLVQQHCPDVIINLGDLIRSEDREFDLIKYRQVISIFKQVPVPVIHLLGNHELKTMTLNEIEDIWKECGFDQKSHGCKRINNFNLIWLGLERQSQQGKVYNLPQDQLDWLKAELKDNIHPTLVFTHCAIDDHDVRGNFFYEATDNKMTTGIFLKNKDEIRSIISSSGHVRTVIQAHLHYFHAKEINGVPHITCPAMGDNICGPNAMPHVPEIYTIIHIENECVVAKAYSGKYCFAGYESRRQRG